MGAEIFRSRRAKIVYGEAENDFSYDNAQSSKSVTSRNKLDWSEERSNNVGRLYLGQITFLEQKERSPSGGGKTS